MNSTVSLYFDSHKLTDNVRRIKALCRQQGVALAAVVKAGCGWADIARAALDGDCDMLADSRLDNLERLAHAGIRVPTMLLRMPAPSQADAVVCLCDISLNSEYDAIRALHEAARRLGRKHRVLLMVELGDRREGIAAQQLPQLIERIKALPMIEVAGIGTNLGCLGGIRTTPEKLTELVELARASERQLGYPLQYVSGGNSGTLPLLLEGRLPAGINHIRVGFSMLLGRNPFTDEPLPGLHTDVFELEAELIEVQTKPSLPDGEIVLDAFGHVPVFEDLGEQVRGILSLGRLDTDLTTLKAVDPGVSIIGASSDHLVLDLTRIRNACAVGDKVHFAPGYGALVQAMLSPYVRKQPDLSADWRREREGLLRGHALNTHEFFDRR
ncbi:alanine/ornithine racemase family PLP-dependent enzyme [Marinobacterium sp. D7]|uniref:alanine/ornithine racemase family PLP-dependent enzyme n=1 Tax=Marinobacterium ramblicola TaxID=2849041 RepID=UPI001C2DBD2A|nr:alanine/ornithine racemase family PLP-dependent enzyme [Marinobacterium ramblicola]MBV1787061.1 alanine/ornithine racemase family PLP-dependent enzyme [Marinobacterium ramblicola]